MKNEYTTTYEIKITKILKDLEKEVKARKNPDAEFLASVQRSIYNLKNLQVHLKNNQTWTNLKIYLLIENSITRIKKELGNI